VIHSRKQLGIDMLALSALLLRIFTKTPEWAAPRSNLAQALIETGDRPRACAAAANGRGREMEAVASDMANFKRRAGCP